ncbi:kinase-like domain-containing protein [Dactylonectria macrodidyma]|uniref:Kinase-like domain-containing protein n=1 Tax=Dactylonectria macrodidyma TaxID=307937 RepID=A0A9P9JCR5_9HYPO|nr:kinase-like domain-containing protein [Dactylonectria macrodidyma]
MRVDSMSEDATERPKRSVRFDVSPDDGGSPERDHSGLSARPMALKSSRIDISESEASGDNTIPSETSVNAACEETLGDLFRRHMIDSKVDRHPEFLPRNKLETLLTPERIVKELARIGCIPLQHRPEATEEHSNSKVSVKLDELGNRKQVFAILILMGKLEAIVDFINEGIDDNHLPFELTREVVGPWKRLMRRDYSGKFQPISLFLTWESREIEAFESQQWKIHVPVFHMIEDKEKTPPHWDFAKHIILPYTDSEPVGRGGYGAVRKVKIHASHHNSPKGDAQLYAVKKLIESNEAAFLGEVSNLSRFSGKDNDHPHLIRLLWTYSLGSDYHLVFPCADGNLMDLWNEHNSPPSEEGDPAVALWFARQCLGIVEGLHMIHQDASHEPLEGVKKRHGRHGDLKPENILWFKNFDEQKEGYSLGVLKISDFGLARFHGTNSRSRINIRTGPGVGNSPTYRAPEYDVRQEVAQNYDIWSLACVLLENLTWYLKGCEEVQQFSRSRTEEDSVQPVREDKFFNFVRFPGRQYTCAQAKKSVAKEFQELYEHPRGSDFTIDLLEFIQNNLLRMGPQKRANCTDILITFQKFYDNCRNDSEYCRTKRLKKAPTRKATDLSLLEPVIVDVPKEVDAALDRLNLSNDALPRFPLDRRHSGSQSPRKRSYSLTRVLAQESTLVETEEQDTPDGDCGTPLTKSHAIGSSISSELVEESAGGQKTDGTLLKTSPDLRSEPFEALARDNKAVSEHTDTRQAPRTAHSTIEPSDPARSRLDGPTPQESTDSLREGLGAGRQDGHSSDGDENSLRPPEKAPRDPTRQSSQDALRAAQENDRVSVCSRKGQLRWKVFVSDPDKQVLYKCLCSLPTSLSATSMR